MGMGAATVQAQIAADVLRRAASSPSKSPWAPARDAEETLVDPRTGRIMKPSLSEYHVPVHADIPPIDVRWLNDPDPNMPLGLLGVGEVGITGAAAAVANAICHATGRRVRDLPMTLDKLLPR